MSVKHLTTIEDLWEMPEKPGVRFELVDGELIEVPGAGVVHGLISALLYRLLYTFVEEHNLGIVLHDGVGFILASDPPRLRIPDVSFVSWRRVPLTGFPEGFWPGPPDLAVEIVSPHDRAEDVHAKVRNYIDAGSEAVWVLWPREQSVTVHLPDEPARELLATDVLDGGAVLPGFSTRASDLFDVQRKQ
ncbi:MAG TPA: Uma2 family endonuclease [Thermomicrobiales bacterium]|nr:Uma2 family endonuclease [Thermomicrobiales bacterium]